MTWCSFSELLVLMVLLPAITKPLGFYMARVFQGRAAFLSPLLRPVERAVYRVCGVDPSG